MYTRDTLINCWIFIYKNSVILLCNLKGLRSEFSFISTIFVLLIATTASISNDHIALAIPNQCKKDISLRSTLHPPVAVVGSDQSVNENATVMLSGKGRDPDPNVSGSPVVLDVKNKKMILLGSYSGHNSEKKMSLYLNGSASTDPDGKIKSYSWRQTDGPSVELNFADIPAPFFSSPLNISSNTSLTFKLTVTDDKGLKSTPDIMHVLVRPSNSKPAPPPIPSNNLTYENSTYRVKIQYPSSWKVQTGVNVLDENGKPVQPIDIADIAPPIESDPNSRTYLRLGIEKIKPADTKNLDLYLQKIINYYNVKASEFHIESRTAHTTLAGRQAYSLVFTYTFRGFPTRQC